MVSFAKKKNNAKNIRFINKDLINYKFNKSDFILSFYTMQFIKPKDRQNLVNKIFKSLNWGGAFFLVEKVRSYDARTQDQMTTIYEEFKLYNGFSEKEITAKKKSLKGILEPFSSNANIQMLKRAGFKDVSSVAKFICFEGFLAIK
jgi:tRNA (cmo5U34)-methyltransferase